VARVSNTKSAPAKAPAPAPGLAELQEMFQRAILAGGDTILGLIPPNSRTDAHVLFGVYRNAYVGRLVEVLGNDHPLVKAYLGDEAFDDLAREYIAAHPSTTQNARWVSRHLAAYTATVARFAEHPDVAELVAIEAAVNTAFDAADAEPVTLASLQAVPPEHWDRLVFAAHPSARRLNTTTNAVEIWLALTREEAVPDAARGGDKVLVWRQEFAPMLRPLGDEEAMMWDEAAKGVRFGVLCEMLATFDDPDMAPLRAAQYLQGWLASGLLASVRVEKQRRRQRHRDLAT
jgi:hypothetical protein